MQILSFLKAFFYVDHFFKSLLNLFQHCFWFFFFFSGCKAFGIFAPWPGIEPTPPAVESEVLSTGTPGKSQHGHLYVLKKNKIMTYWASLVAQMVKNLCVHCRTPWFNPWVRKTPWRNEWFPFPVFLPGEFHGQKEPSGLQSMGSQRIEHDWATNTKSNDIFHC